MKAEFNESNRLLFVKGFGVFVRHYRKRISTVLLFCVLFGSFAIYFIDHTRSIYQRGFEDGVKKAIDPRNPSEELEIACAGLWVGEQNRKYQKKK